jgi:hypothetical protein
MDGILIGRSNGNTAFHNNFIDNLRFNARNNGVDPDLNFWNNSHEGNFWDDYVGNDTDLDGLGDDPYTVLESNQDNHPLMGPFTAFNTSVGKYVNVISNSTIQDFQYFEVNNTIRMQVLNMTKNQSHGFCRVTIPWEYLLHHST